jgi:hypothetical protein
VVGFGICISLRRRIDQESSWTHHHAGHRERGAGAHGEEERRGGVAERGARHGLNALERLLDLLPEARRQRAADLLSLSAHLGGYNKARRHVQAEPAHRAEAGALATQQGFHLDGALGAGAREGVDAAARALGRRAGGVAGGLGRHRALVAIAGAGSMQPRPRRRRGAAE